MVSSFMNSFQGLVSYLKDQKMYLISEKPEIISEVCYDAKYTTQLPKNKTPATLGFNDMVQISNAVKPITLWKREIKGSQQR